LAHYIRVHKLNVTGFCITNTHVTDQKLKVTWRLKTHRFSQPQLKHENPTDANLRALNELWIYKSPVSVRLSTVCLKHS